MIRRFPSQSCTRFLVVCLAAAAPFCACSLEERQAPATLRAHTLNKAGVFHAEPIDDATHYCRQCHGTNLSGGQNGEPSCLQCHGENWPLRDPDASDAPADHVVRFGLYRHHRLFERATGTCNVSGCHGTDFKGDSSIGTPSCYLCHEQVWR